MNLIVSNYLLGFLLIIDNLWSVNGRGHTRHQDNRKLITVDEGSDAQVDCIPRRGSSEGSEDSDDGSEFEAFEGTQWTKDNRPLIVQDNPKFISELADRLVIRKVTVSDEGLYKCYNEAVKPGGGQPIHLKVKEKLKFVDPQSDKKLELSSVSKLHCKTRGHLPQTVTWSKNGANSLPDHVKQEKGGTLLFNGVQSTDAGKYMCTASDTITTITMTVNVEVVKAPKWVKKPPKEMAAELGSFVALHCSADGDPAPVIRWDKNNKFGDFRTERVVTFTNGSLLINNFQQSDEGKYGCIIGNSAGFERAEVNLVIGTSTSTGYAAAELEGEDKMTKTILITGGVVILYILLVLSLMIWCRYRNARRKAASMATSHNGNKPENGDIEMKERKSLTSQ